MNSRRGWITLIAMLVAGIVAVMNQFQVPLFMNSLIEDFFPESPGDAGWLMSVIAIAAIIIAYLSAFLIDRVGPKAIGIAGLGIMVIGSTITAMSSSAALMILGRILQGMGVAVMGVVATTIIAMYFPREKAGAPLGIWNLWYTGGATLAYNLGVPIAVAFSGDPQDWHPWFWFCAIAAMVAFAVFCAFVRVPTHGKTHVEVDNSKPKSAIASQKREAAYQKTPQKTGDVSRKVLQKRRGHAVKRSGHSRSISMSFVSLLEAFKTPRMWLLGLSFGCLMFTSLAVLSWVPTYVQDVESARLIANGMSHQAAAIAADTQSGVMASIGFASSIPVSFFTAWLLKRFMTVHARCRMLIIASGLGFLYCLAFIIPYEWLSWWLILLGLESGWTSGIVWSLVPLTMPDQKTITFGMATVIFFQGLSNLLATPIVGYVIGSENIWAHVAPLCAATSCVGVALCIIYARTRSRIQ